MCLLIYKCGCVFGIYAKVKGCTGKKRVRKSWFFDNISGKCTMRCQRFDFFCLHTFQLAKDLPKERSVQEILIWAQKEICGDIFPGFHRRQA